jgi:hypothetical protein
MGGEKRSSFHNISVFIAMPIFCCATIFPYSPRCYLLLRHDISDFTTMPSFCCATIFPIPPRCHLLLLHDISESTAMLSFCCTTIVSYLHELLSISKANTQLCGAAFEHRRPQHHQTLYEHSRSKLIRAGRVHHQRVLEYSLPFSTKFMSVLK